MTALHIVLISADIAQTLRAMDQAGIVVREAIAEEEYTVQLTVNRRDWKRLREICKKRGDTVKILHRSGVYWTLRNLMHRPVLVVGMSLLLAFSLWVPGRVFFVQVEGNAAIPERKIVESAAECGIHFGATRRQVRSEKVKNALLEAVPQLQWAGVNTYGCVAVITVRERSDLEKTEKMNTVSSIVASRDGIVRSVTVLRGNGLCSPGQAVKAGQVLISGYTDCGIFLQATCAEGEIYAETSRSLTVVSPCEPMLRGEILTQEKKYSLLIGKKRINFYNSSGILGSSCARIYLEKYMTLPGGFVLPVAIVCETWIRYDCAQATATEMESSLRTFAETYLRSQMTGGQILTADTVCTQTDGLYILHGNYSCYEMIGQLRPEENDISYESDRKNSECRTG